MADDVQIIIDLIQKAPLDETIKNILIRDLKAEGLTDFLREQIIAYCLEAKDELKKDYEEARRILLQKDQRPPAE